MSHRPLRGVTFSCLVHVKIVNSGVQTPESTVKSFTLYDEYPQAVIVMNSAGSVSVFLFCKCLYSIASVMWSNPSSFSWCKNAVMSTDIVWLPLACCNGRCFLQLLNCENSFRVKFTHYFVVWKFQIGIVLIKGTNQVLIGFLHTAMLWYPHNWCPTPK